MQLQDFLKDFGDALRSKVSVNPLFHHDTLDDWDRQAMQKLQALHRPPYESQVKKAILPAAKGLYQHGKKAVIMVGEMGVGKTICATAVATLLPRKKYRVIILCPGHLVEKWIREIQITVPHAVTVNLNNPGLKELFALKHQKPQGREFYVIGKERAKNHYSFEPVVIMRQEIPHCPECGGIIDEKKVNFKTRRAKCPHCGSPLWQADNTFRRFAKAEFIKRYLPKGTFDLLIADELHEFKSGSTAQGQALACLAAVATQTIGLTGTLMGGYSTGLFYLLWRLCPSKLKEKVAYGAERSFAELYGILETTSKTPLSDNAASIGGQKTRETVKEKPGVSPLILTDLLLENSVFLRLEDVSDKLPPFSEEVVGIEMLQEQKEAYDGLADGLESAARQAIAQGSKALLGALVNSLLAYPDGCRRGEEVYHPHRGHLVASAPMIDVPLLPKEEKLLELAQQEVSQGRKCLICLEHTGQRDLIPELVDRLGDVGINSLVLRSNNPPASQRESKIREMIATGFYDVMICNPNLIKTGLDLLEFPTLIFFQTGYSIYTLRQASRRSWRIGQDKPVKVYYLAYSKTMQETALSLIASKMQTSLAVEGELSDKGLTALAEGGNSMLIEMARSLMDDSKVVSLEEAWQGFKEEESQANVLLGQESQATQTTQVITTTTITEDDRQTSVTVTRIVRGTVKVTQRKGVGVGIGKVGSNEIIFWNGGIYHNKKPIGQYDRTGYGQIKGKTIQLEKAADGYLLVELQPTASQDQAAEHAA